ncbi:venom carboxylesterase-6-like [Diprion similis]|uniref:venom carboxylesterase-6-like n=1 Tax=Diprion similis TaxID=362088 RepID=UPI001EF8E06A|nr:venom carboxylesterase-6-like [Diprion similis]
MRSIHFQTQLSSVRVCIHQLFPVRINCIVINYRRKIWETTTPRANTTIGLILGYFRTSYGGRRFKAFEGIPYAEPPIGKLRFEVPKPVSRKPGVIEAKQYGSPCLQYASKAGSTDVKLFGSEDCLFLNVFAPIINSSNSLLPVIFFIHGGSFRFGAGSQYQPDYLLDWNVVLITINYRLGPLGFLSTQDDVVPGNMGLKDQMVAMRWVKDNVRYFGGDPSQITIVGQSVGGVSVQYHYLTNITSDLFQSGYNRVIPKSIVTLYPADVDFIDEDFFSFVGGMSISGNPLNPWGLVKNPLQKSQKLGGIFGCPINNTRSLVNCLKVQSAEQITLAITKFVTYLASPETPFGASVEEGSSNDFKFIDRPPIDSLANGLVQNKPWITSITDEDGLIPTAQFVNNGMALTDLDRNWAMIAPTLMQYTDTIPETRKSEVAKLIREHYLGSKRIDRSSAPNLTQMATDRLYGYKTEASARLQARAAESPVWVYYFSYRGAHSVSELYADNNKNYGVAHFDDVAYVLKSWFDPTTTERDREMQKKLIDLWVSYASNSKPNVGVEWSRLNPCKTNFSYLQIAGPSDISMKGSTNFGDKIFWESINFQGDMISLD